MKLKNITVALSLSIMTLTSTVDAAENPTCVLMKFTDDTRYIKIESAPSLSDLVMEKLLASGKFNFKETKVIDEDMENLLYKERAAEFKNAKSAIDNGDYNVLFEGSGFNDKFAQTISTAKVGQIVLPEITSAIGKQHNAEYLIQGTIRNIGTGDWMDMSLTNAMQYAQTAMSLAGQVAGNAIGSALGALGPLGSITSALLSGFSTKVTGIGVQADLKIIKASTGEVIWQKVVTGKKTQKQQNVGFVKIGSTKLNNEMYTEAMNIAAEEITQTLIVESDSNKLFLK